MKLQERPEVKAGGPPAGLDKWRKRVGVEFVYRYTKALANIAYKALLHFFSAERDLRDLIHSINFLHGGLDHSKTLAKIRPMVNKRRNCRKNAGRRKSGTSEVIVPKGVEEHGREFKPNPLDVQNWTKRSEFRNPRAGRKLIATTVL
jgi:hypothetical protein